LEIPLTSKVLAKKLIRRDFAVSKKPAKRQIIDKKKYICIPDFFIEHQVFLSPEIAIILYSLRKRIRVLKYNLEDSVQC
jgi:hypothetical protein